MGSSTRHWAAEHAGGAPGQPETHTGQMDGFGGQALGSQDKTFAAPGPHSGDSCPAEWGHGLLLDPLAPAPCPERSGPWKRHPRLQS